jgi:hypothetical protein
VGLDHPWRDFAPHSVTMWRRGNLITSARIRIPDLKKGLRCALMDGPFDRSTVLGRSVMQVDIVDGTFVLDAALISELLDIPAADVAALMRSRAITSVCETGVDADQGTFRLNLFHGARHARLRVVATGRVLQRSIIDFGQRPLPRARRTTVRTPSRTDTDAAA